MHVHAGEKTRLVGQDGICALKKTPDQPVFGGCGGVDGYDEIADAPLLDVFQRLDQRQVAIARKAVTIIDVVELIVVDAYMLAHARELAQESGEVLLAARDRAQIHGKVRPFHAPELDIGVKLHAHFQRRVLPLVTRAVEVDGVGEAVGLHAARLLGRLFLGDVVERQAAVGLVVGFGLARLVGHGHVRAVLARLAGGGGGGIGGVFLLLARLGLTACRLLGRHAVPGFVVVGEEGRGKLREFLVA